MPRVSDSTAIVKKHIGSNVKAAGPFLLTADRMRAILRSYRRPRGELHGARQEDRPVTEGAAVDARAATAEVVRAERLGHHAAQILSVTPGALYPALHRLEERGLVKAEWAASENNRQAKFYRLTAAGRKQLEAARETGERFTGAVDSILRDA